MKKIILPAKSLFWIFLFIGITTIQSTVAQISTFNTGQVIEDDNSKLKYGLQGIVKTQKDLKAGINTNNSQLSTIDNSIYTIQQDSVLIDAIAENEGVEMVKDMQKLNIKIIASYGKISTCWVSFDQLVLFETIKSCRWVQPALKPLLNSGNAQTQGDFVQRSDIARSLTGLNGSGVKVGVLSDSYNNLATSSTTGAAKGVADGELPGVGNPYGLTTPVTVLQDLASGGSDEGRAMLEIVHDIAPNAQLYFHTAFGGKTVFANGITSLANQGCKVIIDDIYNFTEAFFQDDIVAQAVNNAKNNQNVMYFSAAGNSGNKSYEAAYNTSGINVNIDNVVQEFHNFGTVSNPLYYLPITIPLGGNINFILQWTQPYFSIGSGSTGATSDLNFYLLIDQNNAKVIAASSNTNNVGNDPIERLSLSIPTNYPTTTFYLAVTKRTGVAPSKIKFVAYTPSSTVLSGVFANSGTISGLLGSTSSGHSNAEGAIAVGATNFYQTPEWNSTTYPIPLITSYSSYGGMPILFNQNGTSITPIIRNKPEIVAPTWGNTSFFGGGLTDGDAFPNFSGTSAAAPHAGAVAALMLQAKPTATPNEIKTALINSCTDMGTAGFDFITGNGFIKADAAILSLYSVSASVTNATQCRGINFSVNFSTVGTFGAGNIYKIQLSDAAGSFSTPVDIGTLTSVANSGTITALIPIATATGSYKIRLVSSKPNKISPDISITVIGVLAQPGAFTTPTTTTVCQGQNGVTYSIPTVAGATSYTWTYSGSSVPTTGTNNSITLNFSSTATSGTLSVVANNACGSSTPRTVFITVNQPATASLSGTQAINAGQTANLTVSLTGTSPWSVVVNGQTYPNITTSPYTIPVTPNTTTPYTLTSVTNTCGAGTIINNSATVTVNPQTITTSITGTTFCAGATVTGTYTITGTFNAGNAFTAQLSDASGSFTSPVILGEVSGGTISVTIPANTLASTGYRIRVVSSNPVINGTANTANLTINIPATASLSGTQTITAGQSADLSVSLTGTSPWSVVVNGQTYPNIATSPYTIPVTPNTTTPYTLTSVSNTCGAGTIINNSATVTVSPQTITTSITGTTFCAGATVTGTYTTTGTFNAGNTFTAQLSDASGSFIAPVSLGSVSGGTISVIIPANTPAGTAYRIRVISSNPVINGTANTANLTINAPATASLSGTQTITAGQTANLSVSLTGTSPWSVVVNGQTYPNIITSPYIIPVSPNTTTPYTLTSITNACGFGTIINNSATVTVNPQTLITSITGTTFCAGTTVTGTYTTTGTFNAGNTFTAQLSDALGSFTSPVSLGAVSAGTISVIIPANTSAGTGYRIRVVSSNPVINGSANTANLTINVPATASLSGTQTITAGQTANLSVSLTGTSPWSVVVNGQTYPNIATSLYTISVTPNTTTPYTLTSVSNTCGAGTIINNSATVTVSPQTITTSITGTTFCAGATVTGTYATVGTFNAGNVFTAQLSDALGSFTSSVSLGAVSAGTISVTIPANTPAGSGYRIRVISSNPVINGTANTANLTINVPATASLSGTQTITAGQTANLSVSLTGTSPWSVVVNGQSYPNITTSPYIIPVTPSTTTNYTLMSVSNVCGTTVNTNNSVTVTVNPPVACDNDFTPRLVSNTNAICPNESAVLQVLDAPFGYNYAWNLNSTVITNQANPALIANQVGTYQVQLTPSWYQVEPDVTSEYLQNITFINDFIGFVVGTNGTIMKTEDAGENWRRIYTSSTQKLNDVHFINSNDAWIVGEKGTLLKSSTSGISWEASSISINGNAIDFFDKLKGVIVGTNGNIRYTTDGGQIWNTAASGVSTNLNDVKFVTSNLVLAVGDGGVLIKSTDGGLTWSGVFTGITTNLKSIYFFNSMLGWIVGSNDTLLRTTDGGIGWNYVSTGVTINGGMTLSWLDISFSNASTGWLVDGGNTLAKTTDGGNTWTLTTRFVNHPNGITINQCSKLYFSKTSQNGFVIGWPGAIVKTNDLGNSWSAKSDGVSRTANDVQFINDNNLISVGDDALVQKSSDKGKTWIILSATGLTGNDWLNSTHFINLSTGWAIDKDGDIFFTNNGGLNWSKQRIATTFEYLSDIYMFNSNKGIVVGTNGMYIETNDGGNTWSVRNIGYSSLLIDIHFIDNNTGWISGQNGLIIKTTDGGATWQQQTTNTTAQISTIFFVNSQIGWANSNVISNQSILKTVDGGNTWNVVATTASYITDIYFKNANEGYICGWNGYIATTSDGGITWVQKTQLIFTEITKIAINSAGIGVGVGDNNTIFRFNPNACSVMTNPINISNAISTGTTILSGTTSVSPFTYQSGVTINSSQSITDGYNIEYRANKSITLLPGFSTNNQSNFKAEIKGCNN